MGRDPSETCLLDEHTGGAFTYLRLPYLSSESQNFDCASEQAEEGTGSRAAPGLYSQQAGSLFAVCSFPVLDPPHLRDVIQLEDAPPSASLCAEG